METKAIQRDNKVSTDKMNYQQYALLIALIVIFVLFSILTEGRLVTSMNINNLIMQNAYIVILAIGMLLVLVSAAIDLSVGSVVALVSSLCGLFIVRLNIPIPIALFSGFVLGSLVGAFQGFFIAFVKIPAFIVTLAGMLVFRGLSLIMLKSQTVGPLPDSFITIGAGFVPQRFITIGGAQYDVVTVAVSVILSVALIVFEVFKRRRKQKTHFPVAPLWQTVLTDVFILFILNFLMIKLSAHKGMPIVLVIVTVLVLIYTFITQNTVAGRHIYSVGGNPEAARLSGINVKKVVFWVFVNMGLLSALSGIVLAARNASATPRAGDGIELDAIASCFIGGTSTTGGIGTVAGVVVGALIMGVMNNGMSLMGVSTEWQRVIKGLVLLGAVTFDLYNKRRKLF